MPIREWTDSGSTNSDNFPKQIIIKAVKWKAIISIGFEDLALSDSWKINKKTLLILNYGGQIFSNIDYYKDDSRFTDLNFVKEVKERFTGYKVPYALTFSSDKSETEIKEQVKQEFKNRWYEIDILTNNKGQSSVLWIDNSKGERIFVAIRSPIPLEYSAVFSWTTLVEVSK